MVARDPVERRDALQHERELREAAEQNLREVLGVLRDVAASQDAEVAARVEEGRAAMLKQSRTNPSEAMHPAEVQAVIDHALLNEKLGRTVRTLQEEVALHRLLANAGVRAGRIDNLVRQIRDDIEFLDDGTPIVKATADTNVAGYIMSTVYDELPEFFDPAEHRQALARLGVVGHIGGEAA